MFEGLARNFAVPIIYTAMYNDTRRATAEKFCKKSTYRSKDYDHSPTNDQTNNIAAVSTFSVYVSNSRLISENDEK